MSRNLKQGLDYFSVNTNWDRKMNLFKAKFGLQGVGFIVELWKAIYNEGYYIIWDNETQLLFANEQGIEISQVSEMMVFAIEKELFRIFKIRNQSLLTSSGIQKRYFEASLKRKEIHFIKKILLISIEKPAWSKAKIIFDSLNSISESEKNIKESEITIKESESEKGISDTKGSKVKETKVKEVKEVKEVNLPKKTEKPAAPPTAQPTASSPEVNSPPSEKTKPRPKDQQLADLADILRVEDPAEYKKLIEAHPELVPENTIPWEET